MSIPYIIVNYKSKKSTNEFNKKTSQYTELNPEICKMKANKVK